MVDPRARAAGVADGAREDQLALVLRTQRRPVLEHGGRDVGQRFAQFAARGVLGRQQESSFDARLLGAGAHDARARSLAQEQLERADDQALPRAGLASDRVESESELQRGAVEEGQVLEGEVAEHGGPRILRTAAPWSRGPRDASGRAAWTSGDPRIRRFQIRYGARNDPDTFARAVSCPELGSWVGRMCRGRSWHRTAARTPRVRSEGREGLGDELLDAHFHRAGAVLGNPPGERVGARVGAGLQHRQRV